MNRSELISKLCDLHPKASKKIDSLVKIIFSYLVKNIAKGNRVEVRGFGSFSLKVRKAIMVRNPRDGKVITSGKNQVRYVVYFRPGKNLRIKVNHD